MGEFCDPTTTPGTLEGRYRVMLISLGVADSTAIKAAKALATENIPYSNDDQNYLKHALLQVIERETVRCALRVGGGLDHE
jgi:hypothetical protein